MINICIVHFNTPYMTECLIKSINKYTPNCNIYIFDNSDTYPFVYKQDNLTVFDNTKGQIIDFDNLIKKYPKRYTGKGNNWASYKHCISVEKCFELIGDDFVLMDSDILLKKDISSLCKKDKIVVGEVDKVKQRVSPYLCYINVNKCMELGIHYFDERYMHGLGINEYSTKLDCGYDTGVYFYEQIIELEKCVVDINNYMVHYRSGSWNNKHVHHRISLNRWIESHKKLWSNKPNKKNNKSVVYTCITGEYDNLKIFKRKENWDYVCFTDNNISSDFWDIRPIPDELHGLSDVKKQRVVKIRPDKYLPEYDVVVWIDGSMSLLGDVDEFIDDVSDNFKKPLILKTHPFRNCVYDEISKCRSLRKEKKYKCDELEKRYKDEQMPINFGMYETGCIVRNNKNTRLHKFNELWENEVIKNSHRDQLSITYVLWKYNMLDIVTTYTHKCMSKYITISTHSTKKTNDKLVYSDKKNVLYAHICVDKIDRNRISCADYTNRDYYCDDGYLCSCYRDINSALFYKEYDWILLVRNNVVFNSSIILKRHIDYITHERCDVGVYTIASVNDRNKKAGIHEIYNMNEHVVLINVEAMDGIKKLDFKNCKSGSGFIKYVCGLSKRNGYSNVVDGDIMYNVINEQYSGYHNSRYEEDMLFRDNDIFDVI